MTGSDDATPTTPTTAPADDHEAADMAAYLAAEGVANDYHPEELPPGHIAG